MALAVTSMSLTGLTAANASIANIIDDGTNITGWIIVDNGSTTGLDATAGNPDSTFTFSKNEMLEHSFGSSGSDFESVTIKFDIYFNSNTDYLGLWWGRATNSGDGLANALYMGPAGNPDSVNGELAGHLGLIKDLPSPCIYYCGAGNAASPFSWEAERWYAVALKIGATSTTYYVDGELVQTMDMPLPVSNTITFGGDDRNGWPFNNGVYVDNISVKKLVPLTSQLKFNSAGGSAVAPITFTLGQPVETAPKNPTRPGYIFAGWKSTPKSSVVSFPYFPILTNGHIENVSSADGLVDTGHYVNMGLWDPYTYYAPDFDNMVVRDVVKYSDDLVYAAIHESTNNVIGDPLLPDAFYLIPLDDSATLTATWTAINTGGTKHEILGFPAGTSSLTKPMMYKLNAIAKSLTGSKQITCVGYTAGPTVLEIDKYIALNRANVVCNYLVKKNPKLTNFNVKIVNTKITTSDQRKAVISVSTK